MKPNPPAVVLSISVNAPREREINARAAELGMRRPTYLLNVLRDDCRKLGRLVIYVSERPWDRPAPKKRLTVRVPADLAAQVDARCAGFELSGVRRYSTLLRQLVKREMIERRLDPPARKATAAER